MKKTDNKHSEKAASQENSKVTEENLTQGENTSCEKDAVSGDNPGTEEAKKTDIQAESVAAETVDKDQYIRMLAEYENYRKRTQKEKESAFSRGVSFGITVILPAIDNMERALKSAKDPEDSFVKGVQMTYDQMINALSAIGITQMKVIGETFDPHFHDAIMHIDDESKAENEIVEVIQNGYLYNDQVLRTAMVKVAN